jgi:glutamate-5-semialdehyde dehydrogenase
VIPVGALTAGMQVLAGDRLLTVSAELAAAFSPGDRIVAVGDALLHIPADDQALVDSGVSGAAAAFSALSEVSDAAISAFFEGFAARLADDVTFEPIAVANADDVSVARARGRSTTRLGLSDNMRADMIAGLRAWRDLSSARDAVVASIEHVGWSVEQRRAPLGVVGFVFEGRPNVFADATGVLRTGNTVVFRIGSDALGTARAIMKHAVHPALAAAGLPDEAVALLDSPSRATGWALFSHSTLGLAVARGSGAAVAQLGGVARQAGVPVSLHGTGGAWMVASGSGSVDVERFRQTVRWSLDRKVCNTLNVCVLIESNADNLIPVFLDALASAAVARNANPKLHVVEGVSHPALEAWFHRRHAIERADGSVEEPAAERMHAEDLGTEWEWEGSPEVSLVVVPDLAAAVALFNRHSPRLVASLISDDATEQDTFYHGVDCPFVGDGFTRWVDGQFALNAPELGLSNWENGRLFARSAVLSGDSVFTIRTRVRQSDPGLHR